MENYITHCNLCGKTYSWVGYKTGIGKTPEQLEQMKKEETTCKYCGSTDVKCDLDWGDNPSTEMANFVAEILFR
jgi:hypothetical protein